MFVAALFLAACDSKTPEEHLTDAQAHAQSNEVRAAIIELKNALQKDPSSAAARALLGKMHYLVGNYQDAEKEFDRAIDLGVTDLDTRHYRLRTRLALGGYAQVIGDLEERTSLEPELAVVLGEAYFAGGDVQRARPLIEQGMHLAHGLVAASRMAASENDFERALSYASQAVAKDPNLTGAWLLKGELELAIQEGDAGLESFSTAAGLPGGDVLGGMGVVRAHLMLEQIDQARERVLALSASVRQFPPVDYLRGLVLYQAGDMEGAETALREVQSVAPEHMPTTYLMGIVQAELGRINQAKSMLRSYLNSAEDDISARKLLASLYMESGQAEEALDLLEDAASRTTDPQYWALLGNAQLRTGQAGQATESLMRAVELAPDMAAFRNQLAISLLSSGQDERAFAELNNAISLDEDQFQSELIKAMYALRAGDYEAATQSVDSIITKSPDSPVGYNLRGALYAAQDDAEQAEQAFRKALEVDPQYFPASESLARLLRQTDGEAPALQVYLDAVAAAPDSEDAALSLVDHYAATGKIAEALQLAAETAAAHPESVRAKMAESRLLLVTRELERAEASARDILAFDAGNPDALLLLGQIQLAAGDLSGVGATAAELQRQVDRLGQSSNALAILAELQLRSGNLSLAKRNFQAAADLPAANPVALAGLAEIALREQDSSRADAYLQELAQLGVNDERTEMLRGEVHLQRGDSRSALAHFKEMWEKGSRGAMLRYSTLLHIEGESSEAVSVLESWLQNNPEDSGAKLALAGISLEQGDRNVAKARYEAMLPTSNGVVLNNLAWIYLEEGNDLAESMARQALDALPGNADVLDTLGWILVTRGQRVEGMQYLKESARAKPDNPTVQYHLAVGYNESGQNDEARQILSDLLSRDVAFPERDEAERLLQQID